MATRGQGLFSLYIYIENFKILLVRNQRTDFNITWQKCSLVTLYQDCSSHHDLSKNMAARGRDLFSLYIYIENLKKSFCQKPLDRFLYNLAEMFPWWPFTKIVQAVMVCQKTWPLGGGAYFPYISIETFNDLVRNHWTDLNVTLQECFLCNPLSRLFKQSWFVKKHGHQGAELIFLIYLYRKLKIFLSETPGLISL